MVRQAHCASHEHVYRASSVGLPDTTALQVALFFESLERFDPIFSRWIDSIRAIGVSHTACKDEFRQNL